MKKQIIAGALFAAMSASASASVVEFKGSLFGGQDFQFDIMDLKVESGSDAAVIEQTDDGDGTIGGNDTFMEFGGTNVVGFTNDGTGVPFGNPALHGTDPFGLGNIDINYAIFFDYQVGGTASQDITGDIQVDFDNLVVADLYVMWDANGDSTDADPSWETRVDLATFSLLDGNCDIDASVGPGGAVQVDSASSCSLDMSAQFNAGYFSDVNLGLDLASFNATNPVKVAYEATVSSFDGLQAVYPNGPGSTQTFNVNHDSFLAFSVPEPSSIAILGLGLLGLARIRRKA